MKKIGVKRVAADDAGQLKDYVVGLVSGSLCAKQTTPASEALSSLFSAPSSKSTLVFVPTPKAKPTARHINTEPSNVPKSKAEGNYTSPLLKQKSTQQKSRAEKKLQNRETALKNADDDAEKSPKNVKRKFKKLDDNRDPLEEEYPCKRRKTARNYVEERIKLKRTVFVGNLPTTFKKEDLKRMFKDLGDIESVRFRSVLREDPSMPRKVATIRRQVNSRKPSVNAYVVFKNEEGAVNATKRNGTEIEKDIYIRVDRVSLKTSHDHKRSIFVGNLPYEIKEDTLRQHFEECGKVEGVRLVRDRNSGLGKGFGYVLFENTDSVMLALKLDGSQVLNRKIRVKRSVKKEKEKAEGSVGRSRGPKTGSFKGPKRAVHSTAKGKPFKKGPKTVNKASTSFTGEMADPNAKEGKRLKKKLKPKKRSKAVKK